MCAYGRKDLLVLRLTALQTSLAELDLIGFQYSLLFLFLKWLWRNGSSASSIEGRCGICLLNYTTRMMFYKIMDCKKTGSEYESRVTVFT
jgi:hypothetical protein